MAPESFIRSRAASFESELLSEDTKISRNKIPYSGLPRHAIQHSNGEHREKKVFARCTAVKYAYVYFSPNFFLLPSLPFLPSIGGGGVTTCRRNTAVSHCALVCSKGVLYERGGELPGREIHAARGRRKLACQGTVNFRCRLRRLREGGLHKIRSNNQLTRRKPR